ncbi:hypothetical protein FOC4_g10005245 [Fusarium odoratissimum]|uniref:Uncharacterized protein n=1 Tax=Fusarium oxysporum f. sp. cubense (strain race 4) TaxID=2502994 RepID=N1RY15_FUSC4|nr:hypothetical protein FOC4_g10005245 [Fusarium odoratissimum]
MLSETVYGRFENVLETLSDLEGARRLVGREMESRNYASLDCLNSSKEIDGKYRDWINHACELHRACVAAEPTSEDQQVLKDIELAVALEKSLEAANEAFKRASDGFPKDWDIVGRQVVEKLADSLATALNQAMPTPSASKPKDADDPAYSQVMRDLIYWELLSTAFVGTTDGIAWDRAGQAATFAAKMLAHSQKSFGALASGSESSQQYKSFLGSIANGVRLPNQVSIGNYNGWQPNKIIAYTSSLSQHWRLAPLHCFLVKIMVLDALVERAALWVIKWTCIDAIDRYYPCNYSKAE